MTVFDNIEHDEKSHDNYQIPVVLTQSRPKRFQSKVLFRNIKVIKRVRGIPKSMFLPNVMNVNPRSCYGRSEYIKDAIMEYQIHLCCISESWNRENKPLSKVIEMENHKVYMSNQQRTQRGGKPAIIVDTSKYIFKQLCPGLFVVPQNIVATWILIRPRNKKLRTIE